ncbi:unnamed protein product [Adineta ricciae]|uniref:NAD-dependent epimerase/dehydratase domain-containing protein n=1 Tax=Adineta ricciae TaxID=249248 RepID=A0A814VLR5_ADIRI|nr:unnamed protein product [Adineta ricciae]CAF1188875.1 unnamed protein product [Adineta ricciae]
MSKTILVTGANSFISGWIIKYLLEKGYRIRGTVRFQAREQHVLEGIPNAYRDHISFVYINDIANDSFDEAVQGVDGIIHVASPLPLNTTNVEKDLLLPAINGTQNILKSAHQYNRNHQHQIRRIVITSSFAAVFDHNHGLRPGYSYSEKDWCPLTYEQAVAAKDDPHVAYRASKACAERAAWQFVEKEKPSFTIATVCEPMVFGPSISGFKSIEDIRSSNSILWSIVSSGTDAQIPKTRVPLEVDVRDVAYVHVAALERTTDTNERYLIAAEAWSNQRLVDIIHQSSAISKTIKDTTPIGVKGQKSPEHYAIDSSKAQRELGVTYIPFEKTVEDLMAQFAELKKMLEEKNS